MPTGFDPNPPSPSQATASPSPGEETRPCTTATGCNPPRTTQAAGTLAKERARGVRWPTTKRRAPCRRSPAQSPERGSAESLAGHGPLKARVFPQSGASRSIFGEETDVGGAVPIWPSPANLHPDLLHFGILASAAFRQHPRNIGPLPSDPPDCPLPRASTLARTLIRPNLGDFHISGPGQTRAASQNSCMPRSKTNTDHHNLLLARQTLTAQEEPKGRARD